MQQIDKKKMNDRQLQRVFTDFDAYWADSIRMEHREDCRPLEKIGNQRAIIFYAEPGNTAFHKAMYAIMNGQAGIGLKKPKIYNGRLPEDEVMEHLSPDETAVLRLKKIAEQCRKFEVNYDTLKLYAEDSKALRTEEHKQRGYNTFALQELLKSERDLDVTDFLAEMEAIISCWPELKSKFDGITSALQSMSAEDANAEQAMLQRRDAYNAAFELIGTVRRSIGSKIQAYIDDKEAKIDELKKEATTLDQNGQGVAIKRKDIQENIERHSRLLLSSGEIREMRQFGGIVRAEEKIEVPNMVRVSTLSSPLVEIDIDTGKLTPISPDILQTQAEFRKGAEQQARQLNGTHAQRLAEQQTQSSNGRYYALFVNENTYHNMKNSPSIRRIPDTRTRNRDSKPFGLKGFDPDAAHTPKEWLEAVDQMRQHQAARGKAASGRD